MMSSKEKVRERIDALKAELNDLQDELKKIEEEEEQGVGPAFLGWPLSDEQYRLVIQVPRAAKPEVVVEEREYCTEYVFILKRKDLKQFDAGVANLMDWALPFMESRRYKRIDVDESPEE